MTPLSSKQCGVLCCLELTVSSTESITVPCCLVGDIERVFVRVDKSLCHIYHFHVVFATRKIKKGGGGVSGVWFRREEALLMEKC